MTACGIVEEDDMVLAGSGLRFVSVDQDILGLFTDCFGTKDHFRPVGKPAPPRPRRPEAFIVLMIHLGTFRDGLLDSFVAVKLEILVDVRSRPGQNGA